MRLKRLFKSAIALCITAILVIAVSGCEDLGAYSDTDMYYSSFGDIVLISGTTRTEEDYSVEDYFYNKDSRDDFLRGDDGAYEGIEHSDYVYMAIPFECDITMDTLALYIQSESDVSVYMSIFVTDTIPSEWKSLTDLEAENDTAEDENGEEAEEKENEEENEENEEKVYDDPNPETRVGDVVIHLKGGKWNSFVLDTFNVNGAMQKSIQIEDGQYVLIQFRNNSGIRLFDEENQIYVDPQTNTELQRAEITMTNLLIRALNIKNSEVQGGE